MPNNQNQQSDETTTTVEVTQPMADNTQPGHLTTEFYTMMMRHVVAIAFVITGAVMNNEHSSMLIVGGISLMGVDAGFYTFGRTWLKSRQYIYKAQVNKQ